MKLYEVMNKAVEYEWESAHTDGGVAHFIIDGNTYKVEIAEPVKNIYNIEFSLDKIDGSHNMDDSRHGISDTGNPFLVFGTVKEILVDFLRNHSSEDTMGIYFSAKEPSRMKLYSRFLKMAHTLGLTSTAEIQVGDGRFYIMAWDDWAVEDIQQRLE